MLKCPFQMAPCPFENLGRTLKTQCCFMMHDFKVSTYINFTMFHCEYWHFRLESQCYLIFNHFSTTGLYGGPAHDDVSIRQAAIEAFVKSSFKIFLTQTFPRCGATCYILPSRAMSQISMVSLLSIAQGNILPIFARFS